MDLKLAGKLVVVTGATANIGRAIALDFAAEGVKLVAVGRDEDAGERVLRPRQLRHWTGVYRGRGNTALAASHLTLRREIGRASCRERV